MCLVGLAASLLDTIFVTGWGSLCERRARDDGEPWWSADSTKALGDAWFAVLFCGAVITAAAEVVAWRTGMISNAVWGG